MRALSLFCFVFLAGLPRADAATIEKQQRADGGTLIRLDGVIEKGDEAKFIDTTLGLSKATVLLSGPGGMLHPALEIGKIIRLRGYETAVPADATCASACSLVWLGGQRRFVSPTAKLGFHAAWRGDEESPKESGVGNARVGAYVSSLGYPEKAVICMTVMPPENMMWMSPKLSQLCEIEVHEPALQPMRPPKNAEPLRELERRGTGSLPETAQPLISPRPVPVMPAPVSKTSEVVSRLTDLVRTEAASSVQQRLRELGFFSGVVDGVWGPRSRIALRDFKAHNDLPRTDEWDLQTQSLLSGSEGWPAPIGYTPPEPEMNADGIFIPLAPPAGNSLHPLNREHAALLQRRLVSLGHYRSSPDGIWGMTSRNALREFKIASGLPPDDVWDADTERVLMMPRQAAAPR